jgi:hypothetical protein
MQHAGEFFSTPALQAQYLRTMPGKGKWCFSVSQAQYLRTMPSKGEWCVSVSQAQYSRTMPCKGSQGLGSRVCKVLQMVPPALLKKLQRI